MTLVDSSVWIDYFNGAPTPETDRLHELLASAPVAVGDLILTEVLQGFRRDRDYETARELLTGLPVLTLLGPEQALRCAESFRALRRRGITVRKTADVIIATYCIEHGLPLLHADRDFEPFHEHLGLASAMPA